MKPPISVVLPVYNGGAYTSLAVESILAQTFQDFELLIVDDGSTDDTPQLLETYPQNDPRVRIIRHEANQGLIAALNSGCMAAQGKYIAIMHSDDISLPQRLEKQYHWLEAHPEVGILGTSLHFLSEQGQVQEYMPMPTQPGFIGWAMLFSSPLAHPTVMMRRQLLLEVGGYNTEAYLVDDYELWVRAVQKTRIANLEEALVYYRIWQGSATFQYHEQVEEKAIWVVQQAITDVLQRPISIDEASGFRRLVSSRHPGDPKDAAALRKLGSILAEVLQIYCQNTPLDSAEKRHVYQDAALKFLVLTRLASIHAPLTAVGFLQRAIRLSPIAPFVMLVKRLKKTG